MSDCFDHMADAYDDLLVGQTAEEGPSYSRWAYNQSSYTGKGGGREMSVPKDYKRKQARHTCKYCKMEHLHWSQIDGRWRLCQDATGEPHNCKGAH